MKKKCTFWILAGVVTSLIMTQFSATAAQEKNITPTISLLLSSSIKFGGFTYFEVTSPTGRVWLDRNLGASRVATSSTDSEAYGDLYQWGRLTDGHESRTSPVSILNDRSNDVVPGHGNFIIVDSRPHNWLSTENNNLWQGESGVNNPCPPGFRIPTIAEWKDELVTWSSKDGDGAFASPLRMTTNGYRATESGVILDTGIHGAYWSSTTSINMESEFIRFHTTDYAHVQQTFRSYGMTVRCIMN